MIDDLVDNGFYTTCCTCTNHYSIRFTDSNTNSIDTSLFRNPVTIELQIGAEAGQHMKIDLPSISTGALGINGVNVSRTAGADSAISSFKKALTYVREERSRMGAYQNRLEHTIKNLDNVVENTQAAESRIRDTDMAKMMVEYANQNILTQVGQVMMAQANQKNQGVLQLLQ